MTSQVHDLLDSKHRYIDTIHFRHDV